MIQFTNRVRVGREDIEQAETKLSSELQPISWRHDAPDRHGWRAPADATAASNRQADELVEEFERWDGLA